MKKWMVQAEVTISMHTVVEAFSEKEAVEEAMSRGVIGLCHQCSRSESEGSEWVTSGELDGEPMNPVCELDDSK